jgi:uncharacterized membrane protein YkgB
MANITNRIDQSVDRFSEAYGTMLLRISIGIVFLWFGVLKFFPGISPAEGLAGDTIETLTFGIMGARTAVVILAIWETILGIGFITGWFFRPIVILLWFHMAGTFTPLILDPSVAFQHTPFVPTLEGQYIIKNLVIISAALVLWNVTQRPERDQ